MGTVVSRALLVGLLVGVEARAQVDASGIAAAPWTGEGPLRLSPWALPARGTLSGSAVARFAHAPLSAWAEGLSTPLVSRSLDVAWGGSFALHRRVAIGVGVPTRIAAGGESGGAAVGDLVVWAPVGLVDRGPVRAAFVARASLPTGSVRRAFGAGGARAGGELAVGGPLGPIELGATGGFERVPEGVVRGGLLGTVGGAMSVRADAWSFGAELRARAPFTDPDRTRGVGTELLAVAQRRFGRASFAFAGGGAPIGVEPGVAPASGLFAFAVRSGRREVSEPIRVVARDPGGLPVRGAALWRADAQVGATDADGVWVGRLSTEATVRAPGLLDARVDASGGEIVLAYRPTPVELRVTDPVGAPIDARIRLTPESAPVERWVHGYRTELLPGAWTVRVEAEGYGSQERSLQIEPRRTSPVRVELVLLPAVGGARLDLTVVDPEHRAVEGARVLVDGVPIGTTSSGGDVRVEGLEGVSRTVRVSGANYREGLPVAVSLDAPAEIALAYQTGTVRILARGPDGAVTDGLVQINGPVALPPLPLGVDGERLVVLAPGAWNLVLSSAALGVQERWVEVEETSPVPLLAEFVLQREESGGELQVRVIDGDGSGVMGAELWIDGVLFGRTASGGTARIRGVAPGTRTVEVRHPGLLPHEEAVDVGDGLVERVIAARWRPDAVFVAATTALYDPVDAMVQFDGGGRLPPGTLGAQGRRYFDGVPAGTWEVVLSSPEHGVQSRRVEVGRDRLATAVVVFRGEAGGTGRVEVEVVDPDGQPVGAPVWLDGQLIGRADGGRLTIEGLAEGMRTLAACDGPLARVEQAVRLRGQASVRLACGWASGATRLSVTSGGEPVTDGLVRVGGAAPVRPFALDAGGRQLVALAPGPWSVLVSSPEHGVLEREIEVAAAGLTDVQLDYDGGGDGAWTIRVVDPGGSAIAGARVRLDGRDVGETGASGALVLRDAPAGSVRIEASAPHRLGASVVVDRRRSGPEQVLELRAAPVPVRVTVAGPSGPASAEIRAVGPAPFEPVVVDGERMVSLLPGRWQVVASADGLGTRRIEVEIAAGDAAPTLAFELGAPRVVREGVQLRAQGVPFALDADAFEPESRALLEEIAALCLADPGILRLEAQGHTDSTGALAYNMELSERRADSVRRALIELGLPPSRIESRGFGPTRPIADNATASGRSANRRVEFWVVEGGVGETGLE